MSNLVDSHCHLPLLDRELNEIIATAADHGVIHMLCVSIDLDTFPAIVELARTHSMISASVGVHPNSDVDHEPLAEELAQLGSQPEVVAIGETGLDYFRSPEDSAWQQQRLRMHIRAARRVNKPLIIHNRDSTEDVLRILREEHADEVGGVMHCFVEDWHTARAALDLNFYISFSGIVTFKNAQQVQEVARQVPRDRLLVETDSPYLAPVPFRGKANQPAYVKHVAAFLARLRQEDFADFANQTTANFFNLFTGARSS